MQWTRREENTKGRVNADMFERASNLVARHARNGLYGNKSQQSVGRGREMTIDSLRMSRHDKHFESAGHTGECACATSSRLIRLRYHEARRPKVPLRAQEIAG